MLARIIERHAGKVVALLTICVAVFGWVVYTNVVAWAASSQFIDGAFRLGGPVTITTDLNVKQDISGTLDLQINGDTQLGDSTANDAVTVDAALAQNGEAVFADSIYTSDNIEQATGKMLKTSYLGLRPLAGSKADTSLLPRNALFARNDSVFMLAQDKGSIKVIYP